MKIKFDPLDIEIEGDSARSLLDLAKDAGVQIKSVCGGTPSCAECKVQIKEGEYNVLPPTDKELSLIGTAQFVDRSRLACQLKCFGDVVIDMNEQIEKQASGASAKKPRGKAQKAEGEESHAIEGSILLGGTDLEIFGSNVGVDRTNERRAVQVFDEDETRRALEQIRRKREQQARKNESDDDDEYVQKLKRRGKKYDDYGPGDNDEGGDLSKLEDGDNKKGGRRNHKPRGKGQGGRRPNNKKRTDAKDRSSKNDNKQGGGQKKKFRPKKGKKPNPKSGEKSKT